MLFETNSKGIFYVLAKLVCFTRHISYLCLMKVVIASDKFKGSLSSLKAADAIAEGIRQAMPECDIVTLPVADGGDGTAEAIVASRRGSWITASTTDPIGRPITAKFGALDCCTATLDIATASGIALLRPEEFNPLENSSKGTGLLIKKAIEKGYRNFLIGVGGSATNDAATGLLSALGFKFLNAQSKEIRPCGKNLIEIETIDATGAIPELADCTFNLLCDVDAAFYGKNGAATLFAPQKGADSATVELLDNGMRKFAEVVRNTTGKEMQRRQYSGAAGGIGGALWALLDAKLSCGISMLLETIRFADHLTDADLVVTGEGAMDRTTLLGKAPYGVCLESTKKGIPVIAFAGRVEDRDLLNRHGFLAVIPIVEGPITLAEAIAPDVAYANLKNASQQIFRILRHRIR